MCQDRFRPALFHPRIGETERNLRQRTTIRRFQQAAFSFKEIECALDRDLPVASFSGRQRILAPQNLFAFIVGLV